MRGGPLAGGGGGDLGRGLSIAGISGCDRLYIFRNCIGELRGLCLCEMGPIRGIWAIALISAAIFYIANAIRLYFTPQVWDGADRLGRVGGWVGEARFGLRKQKSGG